jgi:hypothetical protein
VTWIVEIYHQERGTKAEAKTEVPFDDRQSAVSALKTLESDVKEAGAEDFIVVDSGKNRTSFLKQDFRRTNLYEYRPRQAYVVRREL